MPQFVNGFVCVCLITSLSSAVRGRFTEDNVRIS